MRAKTPSEQQARPVSTDRPSPPPRQTAFGRQVRDAMARLYDLAYLQVHPLVAYLGGAEAEAVHAGRALQQRLTDAIDTLSPGPDAPSAGRAARGHRLLTLRYVDGLSVSEACAELGVSQSQYYREHRIGMDALTALLEEGSNIAGSARGMSQAREASRTEAGTWPLVGREKEWAQLRESWHRAAQGRPSFVLVSGEAGIGKTRLAEEFVEWAARRGIVTATARCYYAEGRLAYAPVAEWLRSGVFRSVLHRLDEVWLREVARLLPELAAERPGLSPPGPLGEAWQRQHFFTALARAVLGRGGPLVLLLDDLQWCDRDTLEWLHYLLRFDPRARLLIVGTLRREEVEVDHPLARFLLELERAAQYAGIELRRLPEDETVSLAASVAEEELAPELARGLYRETEGNPLFVVETVRSGALGQAAKEPANGAGALPVRVQAIIQGRLAQLSPPARELAGVAATIGRAFSFEVLARASGGDEDTLVHGLDELWRQGIVRERDSNTYDFSHDKIREVAYAGLGGARRRLLHRHAAQALEEVYADDIDGVSGQVAAHYDRAGMVRDAVPYYQRAAQAAQRLSAHHEVIASIDRGLQLLGRLPASPERSRRELDMQIALGSTLMSVDGQAAPQVARAFDRAWELCQEVGETPQLFPTLAGLCGFYVVRGALSTGRELAEQLMLLAQRQQEPVLLIHAHQSLGGIRFHLGEFTAALAHLEDGISLYGPNPRSSLATSGADPGVVCLAISALPLWILGYPDRAMQRSRSALALAQQLAHPFTLAFAMNFAGFIHSFRREWEEAQEKGEATISLAAEHGFPLWAAQSTVLRGWALAEQGQGAEGLAQMRQGLSAYEAIGAAVPRPMFLAMLARACGKLGQPEDGVAALDEAQDLVENTGQRWGLAELHRLRGELLLMQGKSDAEAEECFRQALDVARSQSAKSWELRVALSLCRFLRRRGRSDDARQILAHVHGWFGEGHDTPDLQEAGAFMRGLSIAV